MLDIYFTGHTIQFKKNPQIYSLDMIESELAFYFCGIYIGCDFIIRRKMWVLRPTS